MTFFIFVGTLAVVLLWYWISMKLNLKFFKDNRKNNQKMLMEGGIFLLFAFMMTIGITLFFYLTDRYNGYFLFDSGIANAVYLALLGLVSSLLYRLVVYIMNRKYKKRFGDEEAGPNIDAPISIYFDMGIIFAAVVAYTLEENGLMCVCVSMIVGEYFGLSTLIEKKSKEDRLFSKLKRVPFYTYLIFVVGILAILFRVTLMNIVGFMAGLIVGAFIIILLELKKYRSGEHSDFYESSEIRVNGPVNPTNPAELSVETMPEFYDQTDEIKTKKDVVRVIRSENDIRILKHDDVRRPVHDIAEIADYIRNMNVFTESAYWYIQGSDKFSKAFGKISQTFAKSAKEEDAVLIHDDTMGKSGKRGMLLTSNALYSGMAWDKDFICNLEHVKRIFVEKTKYAPGLYSIYVYADETDREVVSAFKNDAYKYFEALSKILAYMYGYEEY